MDRTKELLGGRIKELRRLRKMSQEQLSEKIAIDSKQLSRIETGNSYPSLATLERLSVALSAEMKDFFEFEQRSKSEELRASIIMLLQDTDEESLRLILRSSELFSTEWFRVLLNSQEIGWENRH